MTQPRCFRLPWRRVPIQGGYRVTDAGGTVLGHVSDDEPARYDVDHRLTVDEARRIATGLALLPELMGRGKG